MSAIFKEIRVSIDDTGNTPSYRIDNITERYESFFTDKLI